MRSTVSGGSWAAVRSERLSRLLERERTRADRSGLSLSLVLFRFVRLTPWRRQRRRLVAAMRRRARITDEVGANGRQGAYALLPHTPEAGARRFAESVAAMLAHEGANLQYEVFTYTPPTRRGGDDDPDQWTDGGSTRDIVVVADPQRPRQTDAPRGREAVAAEQDSWDREPAAARLDHPAMHPLFVRRTPVWKALSDRVLAAAALVLLSPLMLAIAAAIRLDSPGPAIFRQRRAGLGGRAFTMFKFRTMVADADRLQAALREHNEVDGPAFKMRRDPRVTRIGAILRKTSLDELPQLFNVLRGDMALVGPRPLPLLESEGVEHWQRRRLDVMPGLTCTWQISGRSEIEFEDWMRMDIDYVRRRGLWTDLRILVGTVPAVVARRGAY